MWRNQNVSKTRKRVIAGFLAVVLLISGITIPEFVLGSDVWPQKSTAPFYCLDGGKSWRSADTYELYQYDTMSSALTEVQAKRLFWAYPSNWNALKEAAKKYDPELYNAIAETSSGPNVVKHVKDDGGSVYAWVADNPEIEQRAIAALERNAAEQADGGKVAPSELQNAVSEDTAFEVHVPAFGPGALMTEISLGADFVGDIAKIEAQDVWDNGSSGGEARWIDAATETNMPSGIMGEQLYEVTWMEDKIQIRNNGIRAVHENTVGNSMSEEEKYNKTTVRYKITMRENSGWSGVGRWNEDYLRDWMEFKACSNAPGHQRLYKADIKIVPSEVSFYMVIRQAPSEDEDLFPEYGSDEAKLSFHIYRHEETFQSHYHVKLKKIDDETEKPLKGSQFYLYERFEDRDCLGKDEEDGQLVKSHLNFQPWEGYRIFSEGTTDSSGEITHTDLRTYQYVKTYCDGHGMPDWADVEAVTIAEEVSPGVETEMEAAADAVRDQNIAAAEQWMELYRACEERESTSGGTHFHWLMDDEIYEEVEQVMESGEPGWEDGPKGQEAKESFETSGCKADCEKTYQNFIHLRFAYTWKEVEARTGYVLHGIYEEDRPVEVVVTNASEAGADAVKLEETSDDIAENIWYGGQKESVDLKENIAAVLKNRKIQVLAASSSNADKATGANAKKKTSVKRGKEDDDWEESAGNESFDSYYQSAETDHIKHLHTGNPSLFSYPYKPELVRDHWLVRNHRTEGEIFINKRDMDLWIGESEGYSAYGDVEGDATLGGAVYGLFAADDIIHPDSEILEDGAYSNTGVVYKKHDLTAVAVTDDRGDAYFSFYTERPGVYFNYETQTIEKRTDIDWEGPRNRYQENQEEYGNWWKNRPLLLGNYYIKELSRSEGYELSINGKSKQWTNYGAAFDTPEGIANAEGSAVASVMKTMGAMEGEDFTGNGYDQILFRVVSSGTSGYQIDVSGLPEGCEFYRIDSGEAMVTAPRVTGVEQRILYDENGETLWKKAEHDHQYLKYVPEYDENNQIIGQKPVYRSEWQVLKDSQVPETAMMEITDWSLDVTDEHWNQNMEQMILNPEGDAFCFLKAELERFLRNNGYRTPETYDGFFSKKDQPVYSMGVKKGQPDTFGMTAKIGEPAAKTVYGAAIEDVVFSDLDEDTSLHEVFEALVEWYTEHPQWSFGGIHSFNATEDGYSVSVYAGAMTKGNRRFFVADPESEELAVKSVYAVVENPIQMRWEYQEYKNEGMYSFEIERQYYYGSGNARRYYIDVTLSPAVMVDGEYGRLPLEHMVMEYHDEGEEIVDYLSGDPEHGYRVCQTEDVETIEMTTEMEYAERDVLMEEVFYNKENGQYQFTAELEIENSFGKVLSDEGRALELIFMAKLPQKTVALSEDDVEQLNQRGTVNYQAGDIMGYGEYLSELGNVAIGVSKESQKKLDDTYIMRINLNYRGQYKTLEDGDSKKNPVQILERPIKQKVKVVKETETGEAVGNFQFKIYLKSNLENLYCDEEGRITWQDQFGNPVDIVEYKNVFPELVQKIHTAETGRSILEAYNYRKFFDAIETANLDKWENPEGVIKNTSSKPFAKGFYSEKTNEVNTSEAAKENAKRSDAVRQFAVTWYLEEKVQNLTRTSSEYDGLQAKSGEVTYSDEIYDAALYDAIKDAEEYLKPFFNYDLDFVYEIPWDSAFAGGTDRDLSTLGANQFLMTGQKKGNAYGISAYLPYGEYVIVEQQPRKEGEETLMNRHYRIDEPKEIKLPQYDSGEGSDIPHSEVPWTVTEPGGKTEMSGYAMMKFLNKKYRTVLRIEKDDHETGEPILHDDSVFALYRAEREEDGSGNVKRYEKETMITGSREFLKAMGARQITERTREEGNRFWGFVPAGTPVCSEDSCVMFADMSGKRTGDFVHTSSMLDCVEQKILQNTGYMETIEPIDAGVYVLAELKAPAGYTRSKPIVIEIYSDEIRYGTECQDYKTAIVYGECYSETSNEFARVYVADQATSLEVEKLESTRLYQKMKVSGRVEGSKAALDLVYGLENLELAYNSVGTYLGFGWKKGTLEYLENRKNAGENLDIVYENGVFQGYGYIRRKLESSEEENPYVTGAVLALFDAIEVKLTGDSEDYAFRGVEVKRDRSGNVTSIKVKKGYAGETEEFVKSKAGAWRVESVQREDTELLFYHLHNLKVLEQASDGTWYGYDRNAQKVKITFDTESIFAIKNGKAEFELTGGNLRNVKYDSISGAFTEMDKDTLIYHLNGELCRDAQVDGYTGLAYVEKNIMPGEREKSIFVWPVREIRNSLGNVIAREKLLTGRLGEVNAGTEYAYITGTVSADGETFEKTMNPVYDTYGMARFYPKAEHSYKTEEEIYDRDGEFIGYRQEALLKKYNQACFGVYDPAELYGNDRKDKVPLGVALKHRLGEAWIIPNIWRTGVLYPQDPSNQEMTEGQKDLLRRVVPGTYIMEEIEVPNGYARAMPVAVTVEDADQLQKTSMTNERIKVEIAKIDGTDRYKKIVEQNETDLEEWSIEGKSAYTEELILGAKLALFQAERVYTSDYSRYPKGYYLVKKEDTPAKWKVNNAEGQSNTFEEAVWWTDGRAKYFEGIPAGDYILEELETPEGYLPASMEITVNPISELQSFVLKDDHTKLEILKYEEDENGNRIPLSGPQKAEFALFPAVTDAYGKPLQIHGEFIYRDSPILKWTTGPSVEYKKQLCMEYENMHRVYGSNFTYFSWIWEDDFGKHESHANLETFQSTSNEETILQEWRLEDQSLLRVTVGKNSGTGRTDEFRKTNLSFEYQFDYRESENKEMPDMVSYELVNGIRRFDRISEGTYILVETEAPDGYEKEAPLVVVVRETDAVQRFLMENRKKETENTGTLWIEKTDAEDMERKLSGAKFEVKNLQSGEVYWLETDENGLAVLEGLPVKGVYESGIAGPCIYQIKEIAAPDGYRMNITTWNIRFVESGDNGLVHKLSVHDEKTKFCFQKKDFGTGYFLPGAIFSIYKAKMEDGRYVAYGEPLETWESDGKAHVAEGTLSCGETYILVEEKAPDGYVFSNPVRFTISDDGTHMTNITDRLVQVQILYRDNTEEIESILIDGQAAKSTEYILENSHGERICIAGDGTPVIWSQVIEENGNRWYCEEGELLMLEEWIQFWDGSRICLERERFRAKENFFRMPVSAGRYPKAVEYVLKNEQGIPMEVWCMFSGTDSHQIHNTKNSNGEWRFRNGETYVLEQFAVLSDGHRQKLHTTSLYLGENGEAGLEMFNRETHLEIKKTDITTGIELPGAILTVKDEDGDVLDQWTSSEKAHVIKGILIPGVQYILSETMAADGYAYAEEIPFVLQEDGAVEKIEMEDCPTEIHIQKIDHETGEQVSGAILCVRDADNEIVDQWVSGKQEHLIKGTLIAGATYTLEECAAPSGYRIAEPIQFVVSRDGRVDKVIMENLRVQEKEEEPEEEPNIEKHKTHGTITAKYERMTNGDGILRVNIPGNAAITRVPKTSDEPFPWWTVWGSGLALCGYMILRTTGRKEDEKEEK